jgi:cytochrome c oxidase cbb3-type subunit 3
MVVGRARMWKQALAAGALAIVVLGASGCQRLINGPKDMNAEEQNPKDVLDFHTLYGENCAACHGAEGKNGPAIGMDNPLYYGLATDAVIKGYVANGGPGGMMPGFSSSAGGLLTDDQVNAIVKGLRAKWAKPAMLVNMTLPPYVASHSGDPVHGGQVYAQACASCHGAAGADGIVTKPGKGGSITDPTYLALISDQGLRTVTIVGRPDIGQPNFMNDLPGHPLTDADITDVVAWLSAHRTGTPGNPHPAPAGATQLQRRTGE